MKRILLSPIKHRLILIATAAVVSIACLSAEDRKTDDPAAPFQAHPQVFSLIECWVSDSESPVATEINLDAVDKNRNQFDNDEVKQEDGWTICHQAEAKGFKRYRLIEAKDNHYKVEYQENNGGTLTTSAIIEFSVVTREIRKHGKPTTIRVLLVDGYGPK